MKINSEEERGYLLGVEVQKLFNWIDEKKYTGASNSIKKIVELYSYRSQLLLRPKGIEEQMNIDLGLARAQLKAEKDKGVKGLIKQLDSLLYYLKN